MTNVSFYAESRKICIKLALINNISSYIEWENCQLLPFHVFYAIYKGNVKEKQFAYTYHQPAHIR